MSPIPTADERRDFEAAQASVAGAGREAEEARLALFEASEGLKRARDAGRSQRGHAERIAQRSTALAARKTEFAERLVEFERYSDPRTAVPMLDDRTPLLLFPLRVETRFGSVTRQGQTVPQLWVRVYPDDCLVDSFQPLPSEIELESTRRYWTAMWIARGIEAQQRGAWRSFVASHGSGRAAWLEANYRPRNIAATPDDQAADLLVLAIATDAPIVDPEAAAVQRYWTRIWQAGGVSALIEQAAQRLRADIGNDARAAALVAGYQPVNLSDEPPPGLGRANVRIEVRFVEFDPPAGVAAASQSWNQPARTRLLPERLVLMAWNGAAQVINEVGARIPWPLTVGPDPLAPEAQQIRQENGQVLVGDELRWLTDFDRAVAVGMGFRVDLSAQLAAGGFDQLMVLGVRLSADADEARRLVEELLAHHRDGASGLAILRQGTPTNNTEDENSGFTRSEEADRSFDERLAPAPPLRTDASWTDRRDGEWLADALGIGPAVFDKVGGSRNTDQREAQAMNAALWPATLGYSLETMMHPLLDDRHVAGVRWFFERFVSGRGLLPAIRIGRQPYGILPAAAFSRLQWVQAKQLPFVAGAPWPIGSKDIVEQIYRVVAGMSLHWRGLADGVSRVGNPGADPHQALLDIIGLHPSSVEFQQRWAESLDDLFNRLRSTQLGEDFYHLMVALDYQETGMQLLAQLGHTGGQPPDILNRFFLQGANPLTGPVVDDGPLSETAGLTKVTADPWNYIEWLHSAAGTSLETLRLEASFVAGKKPRALLYLLLRHALLQAYWDSSLTLARLNDLIDDDAVKAARRESPFIHVQQERGRASESRWSTLYTAEPRLTGHPSKLVADFITETIGAQPATSRLQRMREALEVLKHLPTARLERLFAEHLDTCTYRLDAWQQAIIGYGLAGMRYRAENNAVATRRGIFAGAYGWLESVRPRHRQLRPVVPPADLDASFTAAGQPPLMHDTTNGGYIHAPSLNQAVAAAVLRNGYLANATRSNPEPFAINLSSERVRLAVSFLEGIRQGQSLGALLGYQFERALHDSWALGEVDEHIHALRGKFPLVAKRDPDTTEADAAIETVEARNVVDGYQLIQHVRKGSRAYPFGFTDLPGADAARTAAIDAEVSRLLDITDAIADLKLADSVYHAVQSNYDAVAATLDSTGGAQLQAEPAIIRTPRSGRTVTHRVALHLESGLDEDVTPVIGIAVSPRARLEPAVNSWLASMLPAPADVGCTVTWYDPAAARLESRPVTQEDLALQPIDLLHAAFAGDQAMGELDDRILLHAHQNFVPRPDCAVTIAYREPIAGKTTFFQLAPLLRALQPVVSRSRALKPTDLVPEGQGASTMDAGVSVKPERLTKLDEAIELLRNDTETFRAALEPVHVPVEDETQARAGLDARLTAFAGLLLRAAGFGLGDAGWGFILESKRRWFAEALEMVRKKTERLAARAADALQRLTVYDATQGTMTPEERTRALANAERLVRATVTIPAPANAANYRLSVGASHAAAAARVTELRAILTLATQQTAALRAAVLAAAAGPPTLAELDQDPFDFTGLEKDLVIMSADLLARSKRLLKAIDARRAAAAPLLALQATISDGAGRADLLVQAAKKLLGEDAIIVPEFTLDPIAGPLAQAAHDAAALGTGLSFQRTVRRTPEPVDTWMYGVARVREKMRGWEQLVMLAGAYGAAEPELLPLQLPWKNGDHWLGLEYPDGWTPDGERLCYTAHFVVAFDHTSAQCGLVLDDWTEVIPEARETTGLTFHFDRPNAEAPQALLLVTPPAFIGSWQWVDIVDAVRDTFERARTRVVEPAQIDQTTYARFFPATVMAATLYQVSITANLALNNNFLTYVAEPADA